VAWCISDVAVELGKGIRAFLEGLSGESDKEIPKESSEGEADLRA
jgi:hypothetical protein